MSVSLMAIAAESSPSSGAQTPPEATTKQISEITPVPREAEWWMPAHNKNVLAVEQGGIDIAIFGDSITEYMNEQLLHHILGEKAKNLGIKGDYTEHLLWRLQNGELNFKNHPPKLAVVLIGTNNFSYSKDNNIFLGIKADTDEIRKKLPTTKILVVGILPRGETPSFKLRKRIIAINAMLPKLADNQNIWYTDISKYMLEPDGTISRNVMDDYLHPTKEVGYTKMLEALKPDVDKVLTSKH
jgi:lysophospholipase L1-like esterase